MEKLGKRNCSYFLICCDVLQLKRHCTVLMVLVLCSGFVSTAYSARYPVWGYYMYIADGHSKFFASAEAAGNYSCSQINNATNRKLERLTQNGVTLSITCRFDTVRGDTYTGSGRSATWGRVCRQGVLSAGDVCLGVDNSKKRSCPDPSAGNPINILTGQKIQHEQDIDDVGHSTLDFIRTYDSQSSKRTSSSLGTQWRHNFETRLVFGFAAEPLDGEPFELEGCTASADIIGGVWHDFSGCSSAAIEKNDYANLKYIYVQNPNSGSIYFEKIGADWVGDSDNDTRLESIVQVGEIIGWRFFQSNVSVERFNNQGRLVRRMDSKQSVIDLYYELTDEQGGDGDSATLDRVIDQADRELAFFYQNGLLSQVIDFNGGIYRYGYEQYDIDQKNKRLTFASYPDSTPTAEGNNPFLEDNPYTTYHYEDDEFPQGLTGITDSRGSRYVTWAYDAAHRAVMSKREAPQATAGVELVTLDYSHFTAPAAPYVSEINARGKQTRYYFAEVANTRKITRVAGQPHSNANDPTISCEAVDQFYSYDSQGLLDRVTDWAGNVTDYDHDTRGREIKRTDGLRWAQDRVGTDVISTAATRTTLTQWHPVFSKPTRITDAYSVVDKHYDCSTGRLLASTQWALSAAPDYVTPNCSGHVVSGEGL